MDLGGLCQGKFCLREFVAAVGINFVCVEIFLLGLRGDFLLREFVAAMGINFVAV